MRVRPIIVWVVVGLLGLLLAAGVSYTATQLSSQRIGLAAEPPSAGENLAPAATQTTRTMPRPNRTRTTHTTTARTVPQTSTTPAIVQTVPPSTAPPTQSSPAPVTSSGPRDDGGDGGRRRSSSVGNGRDD